MGDEVRNTTSLYKNCTHIYVHMTPLVIIRITKDLDFEISITILFQSSLPHRALALLLLFHVIHSTIRREPILTNDFFSSLFNTMPQYDDEKTSVKRKQIIHPNKYKSNTKVHHYPDISK